jgi:hypothetical protein
MDILPSEKEICLEWNNAHLRNSDSSLALLFSISSIFILKLVSAVLADLLASEWAKWFMRIARSRAALRKSDEV